jgi:hypothetical protein
MLHNTSGLPFDMNATKCSTLHKRLSDFLSQKNLRGHYLGVTTSPLRTLKDHTLQLDSQKLGSLHPSQLTLPCQTTT